MEFKQIYTPGLAHCSYVIGGKEACLVIDPARDVRPYIAAAASFGLPIRGIIETHLHADFVSGHIELSKMTGAKIYISAQANAAYEHHAVKDKEVIRFDTLSITMLDTPGHTPEGSVFIIADLERGTEPALAFTGDTLLVGDAGRPDLFPQIKEELAAKLYQSLRRIEEIGDNVEVYPAHGAGSLCGKVLSSKLSSTIGTERLHNNALKIHPRSEFINSFLEGMPEAPDHFARCSEINRKGPQAITDLPKPKALKAQEFKQLVQKGHVIVDTRDQLAFGAAHIPGAYGLSLKGNFATFAGWVLPPERPMLLIVETEADLAAALKGLYSVGLDQIVGYLDGGMSAWAQSGYYTARLESISIMELKDRLDRNDLLLVDTRLKSEYEQGHILGSIHTAAPDVRSKYKDFAGEKQVAFICNTGNRSLLASSLMLNLSGAAVVINVIGGTSAWAAAGFPMTQSGE